MAVPEKARVASKVFLMPDGAEQKDVSPEATGIRFKFSNGTSLDFLPSKLADEHRSKINHCAMLRGYSEDIGNAYAGAKGDANVAYESAEARISQLVAGEWYNREGGGGGPNLVILTEAIRRVKEEAGKPFDEAETKRKLMDKAYRDAALDRTSEVGKLVGKHYDAIRLERLQARMAESNKAAEGVNKDAANAL